MKMNGLSALINELNTVNWFKEQTEHYPKKCLRIKFVGQGITGVSVSCSCPKFESPNNLQKQKSIEYCKYRRIEIEGMFSLSKRCYGMAIPNQNWKGSLLHLTIYLYSWRIYFFHLEISWIS